MLGGCVGGRLDTPVSGQIRRSLFSFISADFLSIHRVG